MLVPYASPQRRDAADGDYQRNWLFLPFIVSRTLSMCGRGPKQTLSIAAGRRQTELLLIVHPTFTAPLRC